MKLLDRFSLWKYLMCQWIRSQKECRKLRRQRDTLHDMVCDVYDDYERIGVDSLDELASEEQMNVFNEVGPRR